MEIASELCKAHRGEWFKDNLLSIGKKKPTTDTETRKKEDYFPNKI